MLDRHGHLCRDHLSLERRGELLCLGKPEPEVGQASLLIALEACDLHLRRQARTPILRPASRAKPSSAPAYFRPVSPKPTKAGTNPTALHAPDPYLPFILQTLEKFPTLKASRLYAMVRERGYRGGPDHFRHLIACHRPRRKPKLICGCAACPVNRHKLTGRISAIVEIGRARRPLMAFVMVLSYSRQIFLRFFPDARMENFLRGHVAAFHAWQGVPRVLLYDNLKSAVLERHGDAIRFHPTLLDFAGHYRYEPRPVAVARGNEKGRVERAIRYVRDSFFAARSFTDIDDLNAQAEVWCNGQAADRRCPDEPARTVREVFTRGSNPAAAAAGQPRAAARARRGQGWQDALCPI